MRFTLVEATVVSTPPVVSASIESSEVDETLAASLSQIGLSNKTTIGLAVAGAGSDSIIAAVSKALAAEGDYECSMTQVEDPSILPYVTQELIKSCDIVIAASLLTSATQSIGNAIVASLYEVGVRNGKPVIPGIISASSLLEAKAMLPIYSATWLKSVSTINAMQKNAAVESTPLPKAPTKLSSQYTSDITNVDVLLDTLRDTLKVCIHLNAFFIIVNCRS